MEVKNHRFGVPKMVILSGTCHPHWPMDNFRVEFFTTNRPFTATRPMNYTTNWNFLEHHLPVLLEPDGTLRTHHMVRWNGTPCYFKSSSVKGAMHGHAIPCHVGPWFQLFFQWFTAGSTDGAGGVFRAPRTVDVGGRVSSGRKAVLIEALCFGALEGELPQAESGGEMSSGSQQLHWSKNSSPALFLEGGFVSSKNLTGLYI